MIVRELIAKFGIDFDSTGLKKAESGIGSLRSMLSNVGLALSGGVIAGALNKFVGMASDVDENMNVLSQTFREHTDQVTAWAKESGDAMGRSQYAMRGYAAALGGVLAPTLGNRKAAADMSTAVAGLAVDLASFFNQEDEATLERLRSGLLGSSEAVDQLGINLRAESLQAFAASKGMKANFKSMSEAEKVQLRFAKIMADTVDKQGDAARTGDGWANSSKRLKGNLHDVGTTIGQRLLGPATAALGIFGNLTKRFTEVAEHSNLVEAAMVTLGAVASGFAISFGIANLPLLAFGLGLGVVFLAVEDLLTAFRGGKSVIGDFMSSLIGDTEWKRISELPSKLGDVFFEMEHGRERVKKEGRKETGAIDFAAPLIGVDPEKVREVERRGGLKSQATREKNEAAAFAQPPSTPWAPLIDFFGGNSQKILANERASGLMLAEQRNLRARESLGAPLIGELRQGDLHFNLTGDVNADSVSKIQRAVRSANEDSWRTAFESTNRSMKR